MSSEVMMFKLETVAQTVKECQAQIFAAKCEKILVAAEKLQHKICICPRCQAVKHLILARDYILEIK